MASTISVMLTAWSSTIWHLPASPEEQNRRAHRHAQLTNKHGKRDT
jgi:hypothetical protein